MKKEGNHKRAQRVQKGVKAESYKKGGPLSLSKSVSDKEFEKRKAKGTKKRKRKTAKKKSLKN